MGKRKKPLRFKEEPLLAKKPKIASNPEEYYNHHPSWRVSKIQVVDPFGWHTLDGVKLEYVRAKLSHFESMIWREILLDSKKQNHTVSVDKISKTAQDHLRDIGLDDLEKLTSLHLSGEERVWGFIIQGVMNLLWWDPNHQVYPSHKKHT
ncbi:MAG: hypothetical protein AB4058_10850 [Microcystaceae cyanobacterium]